MLIAFLCITFIAILTYRDLFNSINVWFTTYINNSLYLYTNLNWKVKARKWLREGLVMSLQMAVRQTRRIQLFWLLLKLQKVGYSIKNASHGVALFYNIIILL